MISDDGEIRRVPLLLLCVVVVVKIKFSDHSSTFFVRILSCLTPCQLMSSVLLLSVVLSFLAVAQSTTCGQAKSKNYETRVRYYCIAAMDPDWEYAAFST